jgi:hypothetical protein
MIGIYVTPGSQLFSVEEALWRELPSAVRHSARTLIWNNTFVALEDNDYDPADVGEDRYLSFPHCVSIAPCSKATTLDELRAATRAVLEILKRRDAVCVLTGDLEDEFPLDNTDAFARRR